MSTSNASQIDDATAVEMWGRVIRGFQATNRRLHAGLRGQFDLTEAEAETLLSLFRCPEQRARHNSLAKGACFTTGGFTKIADKLSQRGLTERAACESDRRVSYLQLTDAGSELAAKLTEAAAQANRERFIEVLGVERAQLVSDAMVSLYRANLDTGSK